MTVVAIYAKMAENVLMVSIRILANVVQNTLVNIVPKTLMSVPFDQIYAKMEPPVPTPMGVIPAFVSMDLKEKIVKLT